MVCPYLKNNGSAVRFCLWPLIMQYKKYHLNRLFREFKNRLKDSDSSLDEYNYLDIVERAVKDEATFTIFRSIPGYRDILEHISDELAEKYYVNLREQLSHKDIVDLSKLVKNIGNPKLKKFDRDELNPTVLRYINVALDLRSKFSDYDFKNFVELGCGFGGQALILDKFYKINNYAFVDLPQVNMLIKKFLDLHDPNFKYSLSNIETFDKNKEYDLFLSNYAFSELPKKLQLKTINSIVENVNCGYMIVNNFNKISIRYLNINGYHKHLNNLKIFSEKPESYIFNKTLIFKN